MNILDFMKFRQQPDPTRGAGHVFNPYGKNSAPQRQPQGGNWMNKPALGGSMSRGDLLLASMGMLSGRNFQEGMGNAAQYMAYGMDRANERQKEAQQKAQLAKAMQGMDLTPQQRALMGINPGGVTQALTERAFAQPAGPMEINGQLVDRNTYEVLGDYRTPETPDTPEPFTLGKDQVRYNPDGSVIARGPVSPKPEGPTNPSGLTDEQMKFELQLGKDWKPIQQDYNDITAQYQRITTLGADVGPDGQPLEPGQRAANDLALVVAFTKMLDPGSVAREGEVALTQQAASLIGQAETWLPKLQQGGTLLPENTRKALVAAASDMMPIYDRAYNSLAQGTRSRAQAYGLSPDRIMLGYEEPQPDAPKPTDIAWQTPSGVEVSNAELEEAAGMLLEDLTPQSMADFDQTYGPGAAGMLLKELGIEQPSPAVPYAPYNAPVAREPYQPGMGPLR